MQDMFFFYIFPFLDLSWRISSMPEQTAGHYATNLLDVIYSNLLSCLWRLVSMTANTSAPMNVDAQGPCTGTAGTAMADWLPSQINHSSSR